MGLIRGATNDERRFEETVTVDLAQQLEALSRRVQALEDELARG
jgi:hypothetical protein